MPQLHETPRGARFFDVTLPRIADELANLNNTLAALITLLRERLPAPTRPPAATKPESERK